MNPTLQATSDNASALLDAIREKGIRLWHENGQLRYRAPRGALTDGCLEEIKRHRSQLVSMLARESQVTPIAGLQARGTVVDRAPLAFSQLAHWNINRLYERPAIRQIAAAMRLVGSLNVSVLKNSVQTIFRRHEMLRARFVDINGTAMQEILESAEPDLAVEDLEMMPADVREGAVLERLRSLILEPVDVAKDPLCSVRLLRVRQDCHVLAIAMEHMVSDMFSVGVIWRDLFAVYGQLSAGANVELPPIRLRFPDYAAQQRGAEPYMIEKHRPYWHDHLICCPRLRLPDDDAIPRDDAGQWGTVQFKLRREQRRRLHLWARSHRTTAVMGAFAAYAALLLRWCKVPAAVIRYQSDGRGSSSALNTVGFFASALFLRVELLENDSFMDFIVRVTREFCDANEHADSSYLGAQVPRLDFTRNPIFNWIPADGEVDASKLADRGDLAVSPVRFVHPMLKCMQLDVEPILLLFDTGEEILGHLHFPRGRFLAGTMERLARNFLQFVGIVMDAPFTSVGSVTLT